MGDSKHKEIPERTEMSSAPWSASFLAFGFVGSRVTARIWNCSAALESLRIDVTTEPPWEPVAPKTTRIFLDAMLRSIDVICIWVLRVDIKRKAVGC